MMMPVHRTGALYRCINDARCIRIVFIVSFRCYFPHSEKIMRSSLLEQFSGDQPRLTSHHGWEVVACYTSVEQEYWALKQNSGVFDLTHRGRLLVRGPDAPRFLQGMVTNDVSGLAIGNGAYAFLLNVQGHILADMHVLRLEETVFLIDCEPQSHDVIKQALDKHIIADDVELEDMRGSLACIAVAGPLALQALARAVRRELPELGYLEHRDLGEAAARMVRGADWDRDACMLLAGPERVAEIWRKLTAEPADAVPPISGDGIPRAIPVGFDVQEICRIEAGVPRHGLDITDKNLIQETGRLNAVSFNKGCYIGQEVVERVRSRGHVNRVLVQLLFDGAQEVAPGTALTVDGKTVGAITSAAYSFEMRRTVALGYVRREHAAAGRNLMAGVARAEVKSSDSIRE